MIEIITKQTNKQMNDKLNGIPDSGGEVSWKLYIPKMFPSFMLYTQTPTETNIFRHLIIPISVASCESTAFFPT